MFRIPDPNAGQAGNAGTSGAPRLPFGKVGPLALAFFLVVLVLGMFLLSRVGDGGGAVPADPLPEHDQFARRPQIEHLDDGELAAQYPSVVREELQNDVFEWFQTPGREGLSDRADVLEPEWVRWFLSDEVRPRLERLPGWAFGELEGIDRVMHEPGPHRGKLVQVWGEVRTIEQIELPTSPASRAWRLRIDDAAGIPWTVVATREAPEGTGPGSWVKAFGAFVKLRPIDERNLSPVVFSTQRPIASFPPVQHRAISPEWAAEVDDITLESSQRRPGDEPAFWNLLNYVRTLGPEGYREKVASGELKVTDMTSSRGATDLAKAPAVHRFELVRLRVALARGQGAFVSDQDLPENVGNIRSVTRGFVMDDQGRLIWVLSPFPMSAFRSDGARLGFVEGFFYKRKAESRPDGQLYWMPVLVATSVTPIDMAKPATNYARYAAWIGMAGAAACAALWIVLLVRSRRTSESARRRHEERQARRVTHKAPPAT